MSNPYWRERKFVYPLILLLTAGGIVRFFPTLLSDFPLNDGGLFSVMIQNLLDADFALPFYTTYNGGEIPYGYPPLNFYITAFLSRTSGISVINLVHYLPALISILTIPTFYGFCRIFPLSRRQVLFVILCFAFTPRAYKWMIMGGGITRAFGLLFAILALRQIVLLYREPTSRRNILLTVLFSSLTILSHAETGWFVAYSAVVIFLFSKKSKTAVISSLFVALGVTICTSIWWAVMIYRHGVETFMAAFGSGYSTWYGLLQIMLNFADESYISIFTVIAIIGFFIYLQRKEYLFPLWFLSVLLLTPRSGPNFAVIPMAFLFGIGLDRGVLLALQSVEEKIEKNPPGKFNLPVRNLLLAFLAVYTFISAFFVPVASKTSFDHVLPEERDSMLWVSTNTDPNSTFLVITSDTNVWADQTSEWFPVLSQRTSLAAVQGYEWIPNQMGIRYKAYEDLQSCALEDVNCVIDWQTTYGFATYIFIPEAEGCTLNKRCIPLRYSLASSDLYEIVYDGPGATIFAYTQSVR